MGTAKRVSDVLEKAERVNTERESKMKLAYERINALLDDGSFAEQNALVADCALVAGYGSIDGRLVFVYAQQDEIGLAHAKKIAGTIMSAIKVGAPVIGIHDSNGIRLKEGLDCLEAYGVIFAAQSEASGVILQIAAIAGDCMGTNSLIPALSDFRFSVDKSKYFFAAPDTYADAEPVAGLRAAASGLVDFSFSTEEGMFDEIKKLLLYLPSNCYDTPPQTVTSDDWNRENPVLENLFKDAIAAPVSNTGIMKIIADIADNGGFIEVGSEFALDIRIGLMRLGGYSAGFVANSGTLSADALRKCCGFVTLCDSYNIPLINITDAMGFADVAGKDAEMIRNSARLVQAYAMADVPKINIIIRNALGASYLLMNSGFLSADIVYAWPEANIAAMSPAAAKEVFNYEADTSALSAAKKGYVQDIIQPLATRKRLISALDMLASKRVSRLAKKHSVLSLL